MNQRSMRLSVLGALVAATALVGCNRADDSQTVGQKVDSVLAQADQKAGEVRDRAAEGARDARDAMRRETNEARRGDTDPTANAVSDARITTEINAKYARDNNLSALAIDVDTEAGKVLLKGTVPNQAAKARAVQLAQAVGGVTSVENQLAVQQR